MNTFFTIIKYDYLQRTRSSAFLVTLCISFAVAYTFIPAPDTNYSTIRVGNFQGVYNSAWFGYVTAIMTSVFLSLIGFYLVNGSIKTDIDTKIGHIISATPITNFSYLLSKVISNFLVLLSIVFLIFIMSVSLFFLYNDGHPFEFMLFLKPYFFITLPAMFIVATLTVVFEVFLGKHTVVQNIIFFFLFSFLLMMPAKTTSQFALDFFGSKIVTHQMQLQVQEILQVNTLNNIGVGYIIKTNQETKKFVFSGVNFSSFFIVSRFLWILFSISSIALISPFFHRFNVTEKRSIKIVKKAFSVSKVKTEIVLSTLKKIQVNYSIVPLLKTEITLLFRKGKRWLWFLNIVGMVLLATLPLDIAHKIILPIVWFLQVHRLSDITTKETTNNVHYFAFSSYKPLSRLLVSKILAASILIFALALPLTIRLVVMTSVSDAFLVILGGLFLVLFASILGILTRSKKLFEILFFLITYANINGIPFFDYFGNHPNNTILILILSVIFLLTIFRLRYYQLKNN